MKFARESGTEKFYPADEFIFRCTGNESEETVAEEFARNEWYESGDEPPDETLVDVMNEQDEIKTFYVVSEVEVIFKAIEVDDDD